MRVRPRAASSWNAAGVAMPRVPRRPCDLACASAQPIDARSSGPSAGPAPLSLNRWRGRAGAWEGSNMNMTRRRGTLSFAILVLGASAIAGCDRKAPAQPPPPAAVTVARPVSREVIDWDEYTGFLAPVEIVDLRARVGGFVE